MKTQHRRIPVLPNRPVTHPFARQIVRSYPVGRQSFSRACTGKNMSLVITMEEGLPPKLKANILTTMNSKDGNEWQKIPFVRTHKKTMECELKPKRPGLHSFRAEFSMDNGTTWFRDTVPDAWVLVDPQQVDSLRMYTLIPNISGTIAHWKADLKRINEMGFNAIHLLPLTLQDTSKSPYSAKDFFHIDPSYLDKNSKLSGLEQLEDFIEEARTLNIRLCFDLVLNHIGLNSTMSKQAPDWIMADPKRSDGLRRAGYWCEKGWLFWEDLVLINYEHPSDSIRAEIWSYMTEYALFWAKYANDTNGFVRFDNLHSSNPEFIQGLTSELHARYPNIGIIAEYFTDENIMLHTAPKWGLNLNLATPWNFKFVPQLREYLNYIHRVSMHIRYFMPVTSHDSGTPAQEFGGIYSTIPRYVAAALMGTGASGMVQGVEYGQEEKIDFIGKKPKMKFPSEAVFGLFIGKINAILANYPAFRRGGNCVFVDNGHDAILAAFRKSTGSQLFGFLVVCNFDIYHEQRIYIDLTKTIETDESITYCELLSERVDSFPGPRFELTLPPCSAEVFMLTERDENSK